MKAILCPAYGGPEILQLVEVEKPVPKENQVLVKVRAASVNTLDLTIRGVLLARIISGAYSKPKDPRVGVDLAGVVEAVGSAVTRFKPGDEVFGNAHGAFAEYACARENTLVLKPSNVTFEAAASVPVAGLTALQGLRDKGHIQSGQKVAINGASGGVGTFAVQIAKAFGAEVTAICSTGNVDMARSIGADHVIDYTKEDFTKGSQRYDLIVAVNGFHPILDYRRVLNPSSTFVMAGMSKAHIFRGLFEGLLLGPLVSRFSGQKLGFMGIAKVNQADLVVLKELLEAGKIVPVVEKTYPLSETAEALRYLETGHAKAKVVISVAA